jgi:hypothetical protein
MQREICRWVRSIMGTVLLGLGTFVLYESLTRSAARLSRLLRAAPPEAPAKLPILVIAAVRVCQAIPADQQWLLHSLFRPMLVMSGTLLLVTVGTILSRESFRG